MTLHTPGHKVPPGPKTFLPLGHFRPLQRDPIGFFLKLKDYGDIAHFRIGPQSI
jgi:hypothetical protein